jgi:integrase
MSIWNQQQLFDGDDDIVNDDILQRLYAVLPKLPPLIRYHDDFDDKLRSIAEPEKQAQFALSINGVMTNVDFSRFDQRAALLFKHLFVFILGTDRSVGTAMLYITRAYPLAYSDICALVEAGPTGIALFWKEFRARDYSHHAYRCAKTLLRMLCEYKFNGWSDSYETFISTTLPSPAIDKYAGVRAGDVFLSAEEEALIVRHLDSAVEAVAEYTTGGNMDDLVDTLMLICSYQFAMRPIQIAKLERSHVRIWQDDSSNNLNVHLTFHTAKQRSNAHRISMTRRVKLEWAPLFVAWHARSNDSDVQSNGRYFRVQSNSEVGQRISELVRRILGSDQIGTATDLRHTAAQRLVDAGASHEELAAFMGHSQVNTGLVYYHTSASHAERVNQALGASEVYRRVAKIAHDKFISAEELAGLKGEQQIGGVPHGVPITGIGGRASGQTSCPYNPITSCYGCRRFMPIHDKKMHEKVLADMREVVLFFDRSSRGDTRSPAYLQLQRTIAEIQSVITELEGDAQ